MGKRKFNIDQIKKEQIFQVPDGYFDQLPAKIESRIALESEGEKSPVFGTDAIKAEQPFQVPENYFDRLQSKIEAKINDLESDKEIELNPELFSKRLPFQVPNSYFERLPARVQDEVEAENTKSVFVGNWHSQTKWALATAAMVLFVLGYAFFFNQKEIANPEDLISQVSTEDLIAYLETSDISTDEILEHINMDDLSEDFQEDEFGIDNLDVNEETLDELIDEFDFSIDT